jgi:hypothetical protein
MPTTLARVRDRIFSDFLMRSRLDLYQALLESALAAGFRVIGLEETWRLIENQALDPAQRYLVLRHDVDTDPRTAAAMWAIDRRLGIASSYYFRLSTLEPALMAEIAAGGGEASYHYEELATVAKRRGLRTRAEAEACVPEAMARFAENLAAVRSMTGLPMRVVASHGDFVNRRLGIPNWVILDDAAFRRETRVDLEAYDRALLDRLPAHLSDVPHPRYWVPTDPAESLRAGVSPILVLVHPRHWRVDRIVNARDDARRIVEGLRFALAGAPRWRA